MQLTVGSRLHTYEILAILGAGGMGEVYRARDTKLNRDVALKVLPEAFVGDADRLNRFTREAETLAALNHPNIAHVYDAGKPDATVPAAYLVMELVEGDDLSAHISRGPMALADAVSIARQIADALEAAHEQGIVHRDLKPANVKVRGDGTVKVLDFGLAKALGRDPAGTSAGAMNSPTLTARATEMGMIIGTAAYMAPEQARGRAVDRRADVWAFGVVLYEMLTGRRAFDGDDISITLASVLKEDVRWDALPADLPVPVRRLLRRCLEKDPKRRLSAFGDARLELDDASAGAGTDRDGATASAAAAAPAAAAPAWRRALPWVVAMTSLAAAIVTLAMSAPGRLTPAPAPRKLLVSIGADASMPPNSSATAILSPDGTTLAFVAQQAGAVRLFVRRLDQLQAAPLAGTEDAAHPFFSPNGEWIAFFAGGKLKKVAVTGGAALTLCDAPVGRGGTWTDGDEIVFSPNSTSNVTLLRVSASGGKTAAAFGVLSEGAVTQRWPQALPGGRGILYSENATTGGWNAANLVVAPIEGGAGKVVVRGGYYGRFVASGPAAPNSADRADGHLLYVQQGTVFAVRFSLDRLETVGEARPAVDGVAANVGMGGGTSAFSAEGTLIYVPGSAAGASNPINWMTRDGKTSALRAAPTDWVQPSFSPDGSRLAMSVIDGQQRDVWVYDWAGDAMSQLTIDPGNDGNPIWSPGGQHIVFTSNRSGTANLYVANSDGTGTVTRLTDSPNTQQAWSFHPSGKFIAYQETTKDTGIDLMILPVEYDPVRGWAAGTPAVFLRAAGTEVQPMFSPDGRWIAYFSNEAGSTMDVHVRPFPGPGGQWRVSNEGGLFPRWSKTSNELIFLNQGRVMAAPYSVVGNSFQRNKPTFWSPTGYVPLGQQGPYDIHPDGKRLAIIAAADQSATTLDQIVVVSNFFGYLWTIAPGRK